AAARRLLTHVRMTDLIPPAFTVGSQKLQRGRVRDAFPLLASLDSDDIVSLTDYLDERPQRFYSRSAMDAMATLLAEIRRDHPDILIGFFATITRHSRSRSAPPKRSIVHPFTTAASTSWAECCDSKQPVVHTVAEAFAQFDRALDVCNGLLLAYRLFFVGAANFFATHGLAIPLPVLIRELRAQVDSASWSIEGALETAYANDTPVLRIFANGRFRDVIKIYEATTRTAAVAERLAPSFTTYEV